MKKLLLLAALVGLAAGLQILASCADPLETGTGPSPQPPGSDTVYITDTLFITDTVFNGDTVFQTDTVIQTDTVFTGDTLVLIDTVIQIDTVLDIDTVYQIDSIFQIDTLLEIDTVLQLDTVVVTRDTCEAHDLCSRLGSSGKEIIWLLHNTEGRYELDFLSVVEKNQPPQVLIVDIDGVEYEWTPRDESQLTLEVDLGENATITITPENPAAFGHSIDICLATTEL